MGEVLKRWGSWLGALAVVAVSVGVYFPAARLDPEPYHDGAQVAPAVAVSSGMAIHREVFDAYGPITAWLQGSAMAIFGPTVLTARILTAVLLVICAVLLFLVIQVLGRGVLVAVGGSLLWVLMWPGGAIMWGTPLLPWPSVTFLALQLAAVLLLLRRSRSSTSKPWILGAVGVVLSLGALTRPNYGVPLAGAALLGLSLLARPLAVVVREWGALAIGLFVGLGVPVAALMATNSLVPFLDQAIIGPLTGESDATSNGTSWFYWENAYLWASVPLIIGMLGVIALSRWSKRPRWLVPAASLAGIVLLTLWASSALESSPVRNMILSRLTWAPALDGQIAQPMFVSALFTVFAFMAAVVAVVILLLRRKGHPPPSGSEAALFTLLVLTAVASLAQLYPIADPNHLWWAAPLPLALTILLLGQVRSQQARVWATAVFLVPTLVLAPLSIYRYFTQPRIELTDGVLQGMLLASDRYGSYLAVDDWLRELPDRSAEFSCEQGLFAVWNGSYLADSPSFVNWSHRMDSADPGTPTGRVIRCTYPYDQLSPEEFAASRDLTIVRSLPEVSLSYFTTIRLDDMVPNASGQQ